MLCLSEYGGLKRNYKPLPVRSTGSAYWRPDVLVGVSLSEYGALKRNYKPLPVRSTGSACWRPDVLVGVSLSGSRRK